MPYTPRTWVDDETITAPKLNAMELGIEQAAGAVTLYTESAAHTPNVNTSATSFTDVPGATLAVTTTGGTVVVIVYGLNISANPSTSVELALNIDGTNTVIASAGASTNRNVFYIRKHALAAGAHTIKLQYRTTTAGNSAFVTGSANNPGIIATLELKR